MPTIQIPEAFEFLRTPMRYKAAYGGRGGARSWSFVRQHLVDSVSGRLRILFCREIQSSIKESVHRLIADQIEACGLGGKFDINDRSITCPATGSEFIFEGLYRNVNRIKSLEGIDRVDVEEAEAVSESSWDILTPTIRKPGSEIWVRFNPQYEDDATYKRFVSNPPDNCISRLINYYDNPYFPEVLRVEMEQDKARDFNLYEQKWLGKPKGSGRRIWTGFKKEIHVKDVPMQRIANEGVCYMGMDPHSKYYPFCVWVALIPINERKRWPEDYYRHVYAEWPTVEDLGGYYHDLRHKLLYQGSLADMAREIQIKDGAEYGITVKGRFIDTRFAKGAGGSNWSTSTEGVVQQFSKRENGGLLFQMPPERKIDVQREKIHADMLFNSSLPLGQFNMPNFSISPNCKNLIASLTNHRLEEDSEKESEKYKDPSDALRILYAGFGDVGLGQEKAYKATSVSLGRMPTW